MKAISLATVICLAVLDLGSANAQAQGKKPTPLWELQVRTDKMTDKSDCILTYKRNRRIWVEDEANLVIDMHGQGGVQSYRYRFGSMPANPVQESSKYEKESSTVRIWVPDNQLGEADRVLVRGETMTGSRFEEDIDLLGMREARAVMLANVKCKPT